MKKLILSILATLLFSISAYTQCFTPVWTEPSQDSMLIYVSMASLNGTNLQIGDEIGVFDGEECVGVGVLTEELTGAPIYLVIETSRERPGSPGFRPGGEINYRFCSGGEVANPTVIPTYISNGPTFVENDSCIVELHALNTAPLVTSIPDTMATEDMLYRSSIAASDIDGDTLIFTAPDLPLWLSFNDTTHVLSGTPANDDVGDDTVTLRVNDGIVDVDTTFIIHVANANDVPVFTFIPDTVALQGTLYSSTITASDIDIEDTLTFTAPLLPPWLNFNDTTNVLSGTPTNDDVGDDTVSLRINDGTVNVDTTFIIHVGNANDDPVFTFIPDTVALQGALYSSAITASDIDIGDTLTFTAPLLPSWLSFNDTTNILSGTPDNDDVGDDTVSLRVNDGTVNIDTTFIIHVGNANDAPVFTFLTDTVALEDALYSSAITASDIDIGDTLTFTAPLLPSWLSFNDTTNVLSGTPANDDVGDDTVSLRVNDGNVDVDTTFIIHVSNANDAPVFTSVPDTTALQGAFYSYTATGEDIDLGDTLTYSALILPPWLSFDSVTHILSGTPGNADVGDQSVTLRINDGSVDVLQVFVINVENVNDPPVITSTPVTVARPGVAYTYTVTAVDIDGDALSYTAMVLPGWLAFNSSTHILSATPGESDIGDQHVAIRVSDGTLYSDQTFIITVDTGNHAPTFTSDPTTSVVVGDTYNYTITASDIDGDPLTYSAPILPDWLTFYPETHSISGVPGSSDLGRHNATLRVSDGSVTADQSFPIVVENLNTPPSFISTPITSALGGELYLYSVRAEDADGDDLSYSAPVLPNWLSFDTNTHLMYGTPDNDDVGEYNISLRVSDDESAEYQNFVLTVEAASGVGLDDFPSRDLIVVYPNPSDGLIIVRLEKELEHEIILEILNPLGKVLLQELIPPYTLFHKEHDLSNQAAGIYFIRIYHSSQQSIRKLIIR